MRKALVILIVLAGLAGPVWAADTMFPSSEYDADAMVMSQPGLVYGVIFVLDGSNTASVDIYNAGAKIVPTLQFAATPRIQSLSFDPPISVQSLTIDLTCAGTLKYMVYKRDKND